MAQVCDQFSPFVFRVQHLVFNTNDLSSGNDDVDAEQWLQLVRSFGGARTLSIAGDELATGLCYALRPADRGYTTDAIVLPALRALRIRKPMPLDWPFWDAARLLISSRGLSCDPMDSELQVLCPICNTGFSPQQLRVHLVARHAYERACSYCSEFKVGYIYLFQEHLIEKHPEFARNDKLIMQPPPTLTPFQIDTLVNQHSSLRKPSPP